MIIWTRWGIFAFLFVGLGVGLGFLLKAVVGLGRVTEPSVTGIFVGIGLFVAGIGLFLVERFVVRPHLDRPRQLTVTRQLAQPYRHSDGRVQTHEVVPAVDPSTGRPLIVAPRSSLFFVPLRFWPYIVAGIGVLVLVVNLVAFAAR